MRHARIKEKQIEEADNAILAHPCDFISSPLNPRHLGITTAMGVKSQQVGGLVFFFILWIVSLYFLFEKKLTKNLNLTAREEEKRKWAIHAIGSAAFVLGGIFIIIIKPEKWIIVGLAAGFFSLCFLNAVKQYRKT